MINPRWTREGASNIPYFNPEAFARPAYGKLGNAPRTLDWMRTPWQPGLNASLFKNIYWACYAMETVVNLIAQRCFMPNIIIPPRQARWPI